MFRANYVQKAASSLGEKSKITTVQQATKDLTASAVASAEGESPLLLVQALLKAFLKRLPDD